jgi:hypothetical protein
LLYVNDPDNLHLEFTVDHLEIGQIMPGQKTRALKDLKRCLGGDHTQNNYIRDRFD